MSQKITIIKSVFDYYKLIENEKNIIKIEYLYSYYSETIYAVAHLITLNQELDIKNRVIQIENVSEKYSNYNETNSYIPHFEVPRKEYIIMKKIENSSREFLIEVNNSNQNRIIFEGKFHNN